MREGGEGKEGRKGERERYKDTEFKLNSLDKGPFIPLAKKETDIVAFSMSWVINYKWNKSFPALHCCNLAQLHYRSEP